MAGFLPGADEGSVLITVHAGHIDIEENDGEVAVDKSIKSLLARMRNDQGLAQLLQRTPHGHGRPLVIIDDKNLRLRRGLCPRRRGWFGGRRRFGHCLCGQVWPTTERNVRTLPAVAPFAGRPCSTR